MRLKLYQRGGEGNFYIRGTTDDGTRVFESTKTDNKKAAQSILIKYQAELLDRQVHGAKATMSFAAAASSWIQSGGSKRYLGEFKDGKWNGLIGYFGRRNINSITQAELDEAGVKLFPNCQAQSRNRMCHAPFVAVYNHAVSCKAADPHLWKRPRKPKGAIAAQAAKHIKKRTGQSWVPYERAAEFVLAMSPAPAMLMTAFFYTGCRPSELYPMEATDVNLPGRWMLVNGKTGIRGVPIHEFLVPLLTPLVARGGILFRTPRGNAYPLLEGAGGQLKTAINGARKRSGVTDISPYTGRHTVATQLTRAGVDQQVKDQITGHRKGSMSENYLHMPNQDLIEAINRLPVIAAWAAAPWMADPIGQASKLAGKPGERTDLEKKVA